MTLHDDNPGHFEFFLKFMYTHHYDKDAIDKLAAGDKNRRVSVPSEIHAVADKYDMPHLLEPIARDVEELLAGEVPCTLDLLQTLIPAYYEAVTNVGSPLGKIFVSKIKTEYYTFRDSDHFEFLLKYLYTKDYDAAAIKTLAGGDCVRRVTIPLEIYLLADKYDMAYLLSRMITDVWNVVRRSDYKLNDLLSLVPLYYVNIFKVDHPFGKLLVKEILRSYRSATLSKEFKNLVKAHRLWRRCGFIPGRRARGVLV